MINHIKSAGFKTKRINTSNYAGVFGGRCNHVIALVNDQNEVLHLSGKAYFPCGRRSAFNALIESGDITAPAFSWAKFNINNK